MTAGAKRPPHATHAIEDLWDRFSRVVQALGEADGLAASLELVVVGATSIIEPVDHAAVSLVHRHRPIDTPAVTDDVARRGDQLQHDAGEGPGLHVIRDRETVTSRDLLEEVRWPRWSRRAAEELGVRSMLCLPLFISHDTMGALDLYADGPDAFTEDDRATGLALAAHVSMALASAQGAELRTTSVDGSSIVAQAQGLLMQRYELTPIGAFLVLAKAAEREDRSLRLVAESLVEKTGDRRPGLHPPERQRIAGES